MRGPWKIFVAARALSRLAPRAVAAFLPLILLAACAPPCRIDPGRGSGTLFAYVLGRLDEYGGRLVIEDDDRLARAAPADDDLVTALHALAREQGLADDVHVEPGEGGGWTVRTSCLGSALNALYAPRFGGGIRSRGGDGAYHRTARVFTTEAMAARWPPAARLAYLAGARAARHEDDAIVLANAPHKAELLATLLIGLGATRVHIDSAFGIPRVDRVTFGGPEALLDALRRWSPSSHAPLPSWAGATIATSE